MLGLFWNFAVRKSLGGVRLLDSDFFFNVLHVISKLSIIRLADKQDGWVLSREDGTVQSHLELT